MKRFAPLLVLLGFVALSFAQNNQNKAGTFTVTGAVRRPNAHSGRPTLVQAIADAGGPTLQADESSVRISHTNREDVHVDYGAIMRGERPDVRLEDGDVIYVPFKPQ